MPKIMSTASVVPAVRVAKAKPVMICEPRDEKNLDAVERLIEKEIPRVENPLKDEKPKRSRAKSDEEKAEKPTRQRKSAKPKDEVVEAAPTEQPKPEAKPERNDRNKSRGRGNNRGGGNKVVGMGDHLPEFIAKSFEERRAG